MPQIIIIMIFFNKKSKKTQANIITRCFEKNNNHNRYIS